MTNNDFFYKLRCIDDAILVSIRFLCGVSLLTLQPKFSVTGTIYVQDFLFENLALKLVSKVFDRKGLRSYLSTTRGKARFARLPLDWAAKYLVLRTAGVQLPLNSGIFVVVQPIF